MWYNSVPMIKSALLIIFFLTIAGGAFAESSASVKIKNDVSSSSDSQVNSSTSIRIETNGNVTTYSSSEPEDIEVKSINGTSEIKVNGQVVSQDSSQTSPTKIPPPTASLEEREETDSNSNKNIFEVFQDLFKKVFSLLV